jgi:hypothetical protein
MAVVVFHIELLDRREMGILPSVIYVIIPLRFITATVLVALKGFGKWAG